MWICSVSFGTMIFSDAREAKFSVSTDWRLDKILHP